MLWLKDKKFIITRDQNWLSIPFACVLVRVCACVCFTNIHQEMQTYWCSRPTDCSFFLVPMIILFECPNSNWTKDKYLHWKSAVSCDIMKSSSGYMFSWKLDMLSAFFLNSEGASCVSVLNAGPCLPNGHSLAHILLTSYFAHYLVCLLQLACTYKAPTDILKQ